MKVFTISPFINRVRLIHERREPASGENFLQTLGTVDCKNVSEIRLMG